MATWIKQMQTSYLYRFLGILIFLQNLYAPLFSDLIVTKDGSRIKGELILFEDGNLTFQTKFAGKIRVSTNEIDSLQTDSAISVRLADNRTFQSKILLADDSKILIEENQLTPSFIEVKHLWPTENDDPQIVEMQKKAKELVMSWKTR